ncbi:hypothetical protein B0H10DRAFT_1969814, partial [Mycena sp. CBHHK59/15]
MSTAPPPPPPPVNSHSQCCNDNPGDGCGITFSGKTAPSLCQKCTLLDILDPNSEKFLQASAYLQCMTCGVAWKHLPYTDQCGSCHQKSLTAAGLINHGLDMVLTARSNTFNICTHRQPKPNVLASNPPQPTVELNTAALDQLRNVGFSNADCVKVYAEPRVVNKIDHGLGCTSRSYPPQTPMDEVEADLLNGWNITWLKTHLFPLVKGNTELRFHGNQNPLPNTEYLPVLDFYQTHKTVGNHEAYFNKMPKYAAAMKGKVIAIELWIRPSEPKVFATSTIYVCLHPPHWPHHRNSAVKKRKSGPSSPAEEEEVPSKHACISGSIATQFERHLSRPDPAKSTEVELLFAKISVETKNCKVKISWPDKTADTTKALIADDIFRSGKMKHCYKVLWSENHHNLEFDIIRCEMAHWFLKRFHDNAEEINLEVAKSFELTQCRLALEVVKIGGKPSPASGIVPEVFESEDSNICWLLEPLRNASVTHYTGTMEHPAGTGQLAQTHSAFVHYAFQWSSGGIILPTFKALPEDLARTTWESSSSTLCPTHLR